MIAQLSYKRRFFLVLIVMIMLILVLYKKTYSPIFQLRSELQVSEKLMTNSEASLEEIQALQHELNGLDMIIGNSENHAFIQQKILRFITNRSLNISVISMEDTHVFEEKIFTVFTNKIVLKGTYENLLKLMYMMEKEFAASKIASAKFVSKKDYNTNKTELLLELYFQNYGK
ncbi:hypothetical protein H2O64_15330 [Kordia sp. YSTF-M3]|uniref:General secretion pathway protein n=1 Tax=Kordia aestuariivivens TaxID=2759037 RepID=A0ABR7QCH9_9FLAO|nr:hypothetical protein [Kordia aestuariivivens]MBC8756049.1 hypothetical protein [Kordia aestuariivivens]